MRLNPHEITTIKSVIKKHLGEVEIYLFGSRVDDNARGGDIDMLVIGSHQYDIQKIVYAKIELKEMLGDQKIDLLYQQKNQMTPFAEVARMEGIML